MPGRAGPLVALAVALPLGACLPPEVVDRAPGRPAPAAAEDNQSVPISREQARLAVDGDDRFVTRRLLRRLPDRDDEVMAFDGGFVRYQSLRGGARFAPDNRAAISQSLGQDWYRTQGMPPYVVATKTARNAAGAYEYALVDGDIARCFLFSQFLDTPATRQLRGSTCVRLSEPRAATLERDMVALIGRIRVRSGVAELPAAPPPAVAAAPALGAPIPIRPSAVAQAETRAAIGSRTSRVAPAPPVAAAALPPLAPPLAPLEPPLAAAAPARPPPAALLPPPIAVAPPPAPAPASAAPPPPLARDPSLRLARAGTRFIYDGGQLQLASVNESTVVARDAGGTDHRFVAGIIRVRPNSEIETAPLASLWPLRPGKTVSFEERLGRERWRYTVKVLKAETRQVQGRRVETMIVEARDRPAHWSQAGFDRTQSYWYAPEAGWIVRYRVAQTRGTPDLPRTFDVTRIVPPT